MAKERLEPVKIAIPESKAELVKLLDQAWYRIDRLTHERDEAKAKVARLERLLAVQPSG